MEEKEQREALGDGALEDIQGGTTTMYCSVKTGDEACGKYFPAMNQARSRKCGSCFYFHPLEQEAGYCSR